MENPFVTRYDACTPCETGYVLDKCFNGDPRWIKVTVPNSDGDIIFLKASLRSVCSNSECASSCPPVPIREGLPFGYDKVVITGDGMYAAEYNNTSSKVRQMTVELLQNTTTVTGHSHSDQDSFCDAVNAIITDCDCECD